MAFSRALLSVSDKTGIIELARFLAARGVELLSTGGTATHLAGAGVTVVPISDWSGAPEILGGRVKTLTPKVFGAILHDRDNSDHLAECERFGIPPIDLVVVNLYPFERTIARADVTLAEAIEQIDVGGPSMLRAAAKNHRHVLPLCTPHLYPEFMKELEQKADVSESFRQRAAISVFALTAAYDRAIEEYLSRSTFNETVEEGFPERKVLKLIKSQDLRYGENSQQRAAFFISANEPVRPFDQVGGKELSYNNLIDLDAAHRLASAFEEPSCIVVKHTNPCGAGRAKDVAEAVRLAIEADPLSVFGGIVAVNRELTVEAARHFEKLFLEVIIAPSLSTEALDLLGRKKNLRLVTAPPFRQGIEVRTAAGGFLLQQSDRSGERSHWRTVTRRQPSEAEIRALEFAWTLCAFVKSNAIVIAREGQSIGIGAGQMSRVDSARIAVMKAVLPVDGAVAASDAFFPFRDGLDLLVNAGVWAVIQPGGSVRDDEVIAAADEREIAMLFTGERHFRH